MIRHLENGLIKQQNGNIQLCDTINNLQNDFVRLFLLRRFQSNKKNLFSTGYKRTPEMCGRPRILASKDDLSKLTLMTIKVGLLFRGLVDRFHYHLVVKYFNAGLEQCQNPYLLLYLHQMKKRSD